MKELICVINTSKFHFFLEVCFTCMHFNVLRVMKELIRLYTMRFLIFFVVVVRHSRRKDTEIDGCYSFSIWSKDLLKVVKSHN